MKIVKLAGIAAGVTLATTVLVAPTSTAVHPTAKAVGCHGAGCSGLWPTPQNCDNDAVWRDGVVPPEIGSGAVQLRYSERCDSAWVRALGTDISGGGGCTVITGVIQRRQYRPDVSQWVIVDERSVKLTMHQSCYGGTDWSRMLDATLPGQVRVGDKMTTGHMVWGSWHEL